MMLTIKTKFSSARPCLRSLWYSRDELSLRGAWKILYLYKTVVVASYVWVRDHFGKIPDISQHKRFPLGFSDSYITVDTCQSITAKQFFCFGSSLQLFDGLALTSSKALGKSYPKISVKMIWRFLENIIFLPSLALAMNTIISTTSMRMLTKVRFLSWVSCSLANWTQEELALFLLLVQEIRAIGTGPAQYKNPL